jgi:hypothetical protein
MQIKWEVSHYIVHLFHWSIIIFKYPEHTDALSKGCHLDVVRGSSTPHDPESNAGGSLSSRAPQAGKVKDEGRS